MRIALLTLAPDLSDPEVAAALRQAGMEVFDFYVDKPTEGMNPADAYILVLDSDVSDNSYIVQSLSKILHAQNLKGKAILGIGQGSAKLLADSGLVPGIYKSLPCLHVCPPESSSLYLRHAQADGTQESGEGTWIRLAEDYQYNAFTHGLPSRQILPVELRTRARFVIPPGLLAEMQAQGQTVFLFCDTDGRVLPENPVAAVSNKAGNVMALLPHPGTAAGELLFQALRAHLKSGHIEQVEPLYYWPRK